jgi:hypothetical protein
MSASSNGGNGDGADGARPTLAEVTASFEPRDRIDRLSVLVSEMFQAFKSQSAAMSQTVQLLADQVALLTAEVAALKAQREGPSEDQVTLQ